MTDGIAIRPANFQECELLGDLAYRSKAYWGYSAEFMEACRAELSVSERDIANSRRSYVLVESDRKILGYYALERLSAVECELEALFVEPEHIGQGIGRQLIEHAKSHAREMGAESILIQGDPNAAHFYLAAGGVRIGERESDSIPGRYLPEYRISLSTAIAV